MPYDNLGRMCAFRRRDTVVTSAWKSADSLRRLGLNEGFIRCIFPECAEARDLPQDPGFEICTAGIADLPFVIFPFPVKGTVQLDMTKDAFTC